MTLRRESMPVLCGTRAHWDVELSKVRYYAGFEGSDDYVEVSAEDFDRLTRLFATEAIDMCCYAVTQTIDDIKAVLTDFSAFKDGLEEKISSMIKPNPERDN